MEKAGEGSATVHGAWLVAACVAVVVALGITLGIVGTGRHASPASGHRSSLVGYVWSITGVTHAGVTVRVPLESSAGDYMPYTLYFLADGRWGAADLSSPYEGTYRLDGDSVSIHDGADQPAQPGPRSNGRTEAKVATVLTAMQSGTVSRFRVAGNELTIDVGGDRIVATRPSAANSPVISHTWRVTEVRRGSKHETMATGPAASTPIPILTFARSGVVQLSDGGFVRTGRYTVAGANLTIHDVGLQPIASAARGPAAMLLNRALRELETPGVVAAVSVDKARLTIVAGSYTLVASRLGTEPAPTPTPTFPAPPGNVPPAFVGYRWIVTGVEHDGKTIDIPASLGGAITFTTDGQFIGSDGVNGQAGTYQLTADGYVARNLIDSGVGSTDSGADLRALVLGVQAIERPYTDVRAKASGTTLTVSTGGYTLSATRSEAVRDITDLEPVTDPTKLVDITWRLTGISEQPHQVGGHPTFQSPSANIGLRFAGPPGTVRPVTAGCRTATASLSKGQILFHTTWADPPAQCPTAHLTAAQERFVLSVLSGTDFWSIYRGTLTIAKAGVGTLPFNR